MPTLPSHPPLVRKLLAKGIAHQRAGRSKQAEESYRKTVKVDPHCAEALHLWGILAMQSQRYAESAQLIAAALAITPNEPLMLGSMAQACTGLGEFERAIRYLRRVTELRPQSAEAHTHLGQAEEMVADLHSAAKSYRQALALRPDAPEGYCRLALLLRQMDGHAEAIQLCEQALALNPSRHETFNEMSLILTDMKQWEAARAALQKSKTLVPNSALTATAEGYYFFKFGDMPAAAEAFRQALKLDPKLSLAYLPLGVALAEMDERERAKDCYERALAARPNNSEALFCMSLVHLSEGDFRHGWAGYEYRKTGRRVRTEFLQPQWKGEPLEGARILLYAEQGLGDTLQFIRYVPHVAARGGKVILAVQARLHRLLAGTEGASQVVRDDEPFPDFDQHCRLASLPLAFETNLESIPANIPYVKADPALMEAWRLRLEGEPLKIGLVWAGSPKNPNERRRSIPLELLAPLTKLGGATFYSLQMGPAANQVQELGPRVRLVDLQDEQSDFADTAAIIANLDLVISVDTSVAHLAAAMGRPVWIFLHGAPDWRWMLERTDSPWYPTARLFRQWLLGDWQDVINRVERELGATIAVATTAKKENAMSQTVQAPAVLDVIRFLQKKAGTVCRAPQSGDRIGFALSSKDRVSFTRQTIEGIDTDGGFDVIWNDGSDDPEALALPKEITFKNAHLAEVNYGVKGGPDRSICFGLKRLLDLGYDYVGLIENDIVMQAGWFRRLMNLFELAAADGIVCGAATIRSYEGRVIEHRSGYSLNWGTGAGMVLFSRPAAEVILRQYAKLQMTSMSMMRFYSRMFGISLNMYLQNKAGEWTQQEARLTLDWGYTPMLYMHGYASVGSIPSLARDLEFAPGHFLLSDYVQPERNNAGLIRRRNPLPMA